ncbi:MAG: redoxin domain-containing protein [Planctomycetes bacterium]|nr:redoxin domain-containing protein [Planctomycetota bacterium]
MSCCRSYSSRSLLLGALLPALLLSAAGCSDPPPAQLAPGASGGAATLNEAERLLARMIEAYSKADSYADRGELRITGKKQGQPTEWKVPFAVMLVRPNKLHLRLYQGNYVCDGTNCWGWTEDLPGYLLKRPAPKAITLGEVYADEVMRGVLSEGLAGGSLPLELLLGSDAMELVRAGGQRPELLSDDYVEGHECRRVRVRRDDGDLVYWIDRATHTLRRMDFPTKRLAPALADPYPPTDLAMFAEFVDAQLNSQIAPESFQFDPPPQIKVVDKLDPNWAAPPPVPPARVLGEKIGSFTLRGLDGRAQSADDLRGKPTALIFWTLSSSECQPALAALNEAYSKLADKSALRVLAVSIDPAGQGGITDDELRKVFRDGKIDLPIARDVENAAVRTLDVRFVPSIYLVDRDGVVQDNEIGLNPTLADQLPQRVADLVAGKPLVQACRDRYADRAKKYEQSQQSQAQAATDAAVPQAKTAAKSSPKTLKLSEVWKSTEVKQPGYVLATDDKSGPRVLVVDGLKNVAELDGQGKLVKSHALDLPKEPEGVVGFLRTTVDKAGKRFFVGSLSSQQQLHVFDSGFKRLLSFPEGSHAGISDVQLGDLDGDGEPEMCVGYWGLVGLQAVALDGSRKWSNRQLPENVLRVAITGKDSGGKRLVLCTTGLMTVAIIDEQGQTLREMPIGARAVRLVAAADLNGDGGAELCALAAQGPGNDTAVGFDGSGRELWNYSLPQGVQPVPQMQNEMVVGGPLFDDGSPSGKDNGAWLFAGADGTLHVVAADGKPIDQFGWGKPIHGLALTKIDGRATVLVSDAESVTAFRLQR